MHKLIVWYCNCVVNTAGCPNGCSRHGQCLLEDGVYRCSCADGWAGTDCSIALELSCSDNEDNDEGKDIYIYHKFHDLQSQLHYIILFNVTVHNVVKIIPFNFSCAFCKYYLRRNQKYFLNSKWLIIWHWHYHFEDGMTDCSDSECCSRPECSEHIMCLASNDPVEVLLRKQPPSVTASFYQRVKFLIEENSVQSYAHMDEYSER